MENVGDLLSRASCFSDLEQALLVQRAALLAQIITRRKDLNISQRELAEKTGLKQSTIARMESGLVVPRIDSLLKIFYALGLKMSLVPDETATTSELDTMDFAIDPNFEQTDAPFDRKLQIV
ncbi:MAG: helix-turn-helix domain-containing protein [Tumebacillaceae bacterium]